MKNPWISLVAVCTMVIGVYAYMAQSGRLELLSLNAADTYYNLLVQGFRTGQLSLKKEVPPGLEQLANPYDAVAHRIYELPPYRLLDLSYYKGKLYLYWGVTPALILFWPSVALTGHYLLHRQAVLIFCAIGFLVSMGLLRALWRRYFAEVSTAVVVACAVALGLATGVPVLLARSDVCEVPISCGYMLTMLALAAIWRALHEPERRCQWLAAASAAYGLAVAARPSLLFGAAILLVPVAQTWRERRQIWPLLVAATGPILLVGLGLMLYNSLRFDNPFEFGWRYQLNADQQATQQPFSLHFFWFNFRVYFLEPARWSARFPFVYDIAVPPMPPGYGHVEKPFGILTNMPLVWLALAAPLAWRGRPTETRSMLRRFVMAVAMLFGICTLTIGLFFAACFRYEVEFLPALVLLAIVGIFGLERALAPTSEFEQTNRACWRRAARWGWGVLLALSVAFNLLASTGYYAEAHCYLGIDLQWAGRLQEAIRQYEQALRLKPDYPEAHSNLGAALERAGRPQDAIEHYQQALRIKPDFADAHYNLGSALLRLGRIDEAIEHWEQALRIKPDFAEGHNNLGAALRQAGRVQEAIKQFEQALQIKPDYANAHYNLGAALEQTGQITEAIGHYEQAVRIQPDFTEARNALARLQVRQ